MEVNNYGINEIRELSRSGGHGTDGVSKTSEKN